MTIALLPLSASTYRPHALHTSERIWTETNCYVDVWVEVLHSLGADPVAGAAFTLSSDFEGDQWGFFKYPPEDLRALWGIEVSEINVWRPVIDHVAEHLERGRLCTVEVDSWFLPDTRGVSYRIAHTKSTIVPQSLDLDGGCLGYFHNAGYFELEGEDFEGVFRSGRFADPDALDPYVEQVRLERMEATPPDLVDRVADLTAMHLARRPVDNPIARMGQRLLADLEWLSGQDLDTFHLYAFGTCRQSGANAELAASFVDWLVERDTDRSRGLEPAASRLRSVSEGAKALQFAMARVVRGRSLDLEAIIGPMVGDWQHAMDLLTEHYGD